MRPSRSSGELHITIPKNVERLERTGTLCAMPDEELHELQKGLEKMLIAVEQRRKKLGCFHRDPNFYRPLKPIFTLRNSLHDDHAKVEHDEIRREQQRDALHSDDDEVIQATDVPQRFWKFAKKYRTKVNSEVVRQFHELFIEKFELENLEHLFDFHMIDDEEDEDEEEEDESTSPVESPRTSRYRLRSEGPSRPAKRRHQDDSQTPSTSKRSRSSRSKHNRQRESSDDSSRDDSECNTDADVASSEACSSRGYNRRNQRHPRSRRGRHKQSYAEDDGDGDDEDEGDEDEDEVEEKEVEEEEEGEGGDDGDEEMDDEEEEDEDDSDDSEEASTSDESSSCSDSNDSRSPESREKALKYQALKKKLREMKRNSIQYVEEVEDIPIMEIDDDMEIDNVSIILASEQKKLKSLLPTLHLICDHTFQHVLAEHAIYKRNEAVRASEERVFKYYDHLYGKTSRIRELNDSEIAECNRLVQSHRDLVKHFFGEENPSEPGTSGAPGCSWTGRHKKHDR